MTEGTKDRLTFVYLCVCFLSASAALGFMGCVCVYALIVGVWP